MSPGAALITLGSEADQYSRLNHPGEGMFAGQRLQPADSNKDLPQLWDPPQEGPPRPRRPDMQRFERGVLEGREPDLFEKPPERRPGQSLADYEEMMEEYWTRRLEGGPGSSAKLRLRAEALESRRRAASRGERPARQGRSVAEGLDPRLDFLKQDKELAPLQAEVAVLERTVEELDAEPGTSFGFGQRAASTETVPRDKKKEPPPGDWRAGLHRLAVFYIAPFIPAFYFANSLSKRTGIQWKRWQLAVFGLLPLPVWAQATIAKAQLQPWTKTDSNVPVELFLAALAGGVPPLVVSYTGKNRKWLALGCTTLLAFGVGVATPAIKPTQLNRDVEEAVRLGQRPASE